MSWSAIIAAVMTSVFGAGLAAYMKWKMGRNAEEERGENEALRRAMEAERFKSKVAVDPDDPNNWLLIDDDKTTISVPDSSS